MNESHYLPCGPGSIPSYSRVLQGIFLWLITLCQPALSQHRRKGLDLASMAVQFCSRDRIHFQTQPKYTVCENALFRCTFEQWNWECDRANAPTASHVVHSPTEVTQRLNRPNTTCTKKTAAVLTTRALLWIILWYDSLPLLMFKFRRDWNGSIKPTAKRCVMVKKTM